jgi:hypothetical protein
MKIAYRLAIEMAAHGMVSGTLKEWPVLLEALVEAWWDGSFYEQPTGETSALKAKAMARRVLGLK